MRSYDHARGQVTRQRWESDPGSDEAKHEGQSEGSRQGDDKGHWRVHEGRFLKYC
jgi:hypothetical protein